MGVFGNAINGPRLGFSWSLFKCVLYSNGGRLRWNKKCGTDPRFSLSPSTSCLSFSPWLFLYLLSSLPFSFFFLSPPFSFFLLFSLL